jgi:hypothetical protein
MSDEVERRMIALESRIDDLETLVNLALRLIAVENPVSALLRRYGATAAEDAAVHALFDDLVARSERGGMYSPSFSGFENELFDRFPKVRGNREFVSLLLDTLKLDRPAYQKLHAYIVRAQWPETG